SEAGGKKVHVLGTGSPRAVNVNEEALMSSKSIEANGLLVGAKDKMNGWEDEAEASSGGIAVKPFTAIEITPFLGGFRAVIVDLILKHITQAWERPKSSGFIPSIASVPQVHVLSQSPTQLRPGFIFATAPVGCKPPGKSLLTSSRAPLQLPQALSETPRDRVTSALDSLISPSTPLQIVRPTQGLLWPDLHTPASSWQPLLGETVEMEEREQTDIILHISPLLCCHLNSALTALNGAFMPLKGSSVSPFPEFTFCDALCRCPARQSVPEAEPLACRGAPDDPTVAPCSQAKKAQLSPAGLTHDSCCYGCLSDPLNSDLWLFKVPITCGRKTGVKNYRGIHLWVGAGWKSTFVDSPVVEPTTKGEREQLCMDEAAILREFSSSFHQHYRLCARSLLKAWAIDGSISLHAPPEALFKELVEKKDALISSSAYGPRCVIPSRHLIQDVLVLYFPGSCLQTVIGLYGETIEVPCNNGNNKADGLIFTKWKYVKDDGSPGDLLVKQAQKDEATVSATDSYKTRVSIAANSSLMIAQGSLADQRVFTCMVVSLTNLQEYPVEVKVYKKPSAPVIKNKAKDLENGKLTQEPVTGLSSTSSRLQYTARKEDVASQFTCVAMHEIGAKQVSAPDTFPIYYPTEKVNLQVISQSPIREGDDVTLKCQADGNPPPTSFNFEIKGKKVTLVDKDVYTLTGVTRADSGVYKCSLLDNEEMESTQIVTVSYLDVSLTPAGKVLKNLGESLVVSLEKNASVEPKVTWTKDNRKLDKLPDFSRLSYSDAGLYVCDVSVEGIKHSLSFELTVEGVPKITSLTKHRSTNGKHKVLMCEAEGSPKPDVLWSVNGTDDEASYVNGKATYKLTVVPSKNLTVSCHVTNKLGSDMKDISVFSRK
ncbi:hypothetical protein DNTS_021664, partial [Danionella cerebrum]